MAFLLGGMVKGKAAQAPFVVDWHTLSSKLDRKFSHHFMWALQMEEARDPAKEHIVPTRMFSKDDRVVEYLKKQWLGQGWMNLSEKMKGALAGRAYEMFLNAFEHSGAIAVFCSGEHSRRSKKLKLAVVDFGVGIPGTVRPYIKRELDRDANDMQCLRWAMQGGATTKPGAPRGLGFDLLGEMVKLNDGRLDIYSHGAHAMVTAKERTVSKFAPSFAGTLVNITFRCDDLYYYLESEESDQPFF